MRRRSFATALLSLIAGVGIRPARSTRAALPTRPLGRTGLDVTILGLGGHHVAVSGSEAGAVPRYVWLHGFVSEPAIPQ